MSSSPPESPADPTGRETATWYQVVLAAIGDAVLTTDPAGLVSDINPVAESLTGWTAAEAKGQPLEEVCQIRNEATQTIAEQPVRKVIETGVIRGLANHAVLVTRDGREFPIDDSAAPVWDETGTLIGVVMIFRDITQRREGEQLIESAREFAESLISTVREPLVVLKPDLHVRSANRSFYETFQVEPAATEGAFIYDLGDGPWNIPALKKLLEEIVPQNSSFADFEVRHNFETIGPRTMLLNARRFPPDGKWELILLAIADITERKRLKEEREQFLEAAEAARAKAEAASAQLADADRHKNQFLTMLAHELRNPLAAVRNAVEVAHSAEDALTIAREHRPEVMLLDIGLPGTDGYELASILRNDEWSKDWVLIAVSGYGEESARNRSKQAGFNHHLVKPVNFDSVLALIGQS